VEPGGLELTYSAEVLDKELLAAAEDFTNSLQVDNVGRLFGKSVMSRIGAAKRTVEERLSSPFSIMVSGDFKRGKSTLINALVGEALAPVDVQPETISINRIEYSDEFSARIQSKDGGVAAIAREDLKRERLEPIFARLSAPLRHLRVGAPVEMLRRVTLIDTPGLGDMFRKFEPLVRDYMDQADTIVYVLSSTSPLSQTEQEFLLGAVAPRHFPKMFFVVNAIDALASEDDERRVMDLIRAKLNRIMPGASVYAISALDEWSRTSGGARPLPARAESLERSFAAFRRDLDAAIQFRQRYYVLDRTAQAFSEIVDLVGQHAAGLQAALQHGQEQLETAVATLEQGRQTESKEFQAASDALEKGFDRLRREADGWMSEFVDRIERDVIKSLASFKASQIRQHLPFFMKDRLRKAIEACVLAHEPVISELMEEYAQGVAAQTAKAVQTMPDFDRATPVPAQRWSKLQTAQLVVQFLPVAFLLQVGLAMFSRQRIDAQSAQVADAVAKSLPELRDEVRQQLRDAYSSVKTQLVAEWTRQHEKELEARLEDLKQAVQLRESGGQRVADAQTKLTEVREIVDAQKTFLDQFRPKVWSGIDAGGFPA
jgi:tRNA U34 5-carboxymethylaminomethyl modifying GTPase MnmE/TrmE